MTDNDALKRIRFAMKMNDATMLEMLESGGMRVPPATLDSWFLKEEDEGYAECPKAALSALLDGMIVRFRGPREPGAKAGASVASGASEASGAAQTDAAAPVPADPEHAELDNNIILKKLRIALELKEEDLMAIMKLSGVELSRNELSALFRRKGQANYRECMDQFLRNFLAGLARYGKLRDRVPPP